SCFMSWTKQSCFGSPGSAGHVAIVPGLEFTTQSPERSVFDSSSRIAVLETSAATSTPTIVLPHLLAIVTLLAASTQRLSIPRAPPPKVPSSIGVLGGVGGSYRWANELSPPLQPATSSRNTGNHILCITSSRPRVRDARDLSRKS